MNGCVEDPSTDLPSQSIQTKEPSSGNLLSSKIKVYFLFYLCNLYLFPSEGGGSSHSFSSGKKMKDKILTKIDLIDDYMKGTYFQCRRLICTILHICAFS